MDKIKTILILIILSAFLLIAACKKSTVTDISAIKESIKSGTCEGLIGEEKDRCHMGLAVKDKDKAHCEFIENTAIKQDCIIMLSSI